MKKGDSTISLNKPTKVNHTSLLEKSTYGLYFLGQNLLYNLVSTFLLTYYLEFAFIPLLATTVLITVTKLWDAINDPLFGTIIDNAEIKGGKFKPWILVSSVLLPFSTILLFVVPMKATVIVKVVFSFVTYLLWDIIYTVSDAPAYALSTVMTDNIDERNRIMMFNRVGSGVGVLLAMGLLPVMFKKLGPLKTVIPVVIIACVTMVPIAFTAKERFVQKNVKSEDGAFKEMFAYMKSNKFLFIFYLSVAIRGILKVALTNQIAIVLFDDLSVAGLFGIASMVPMILPMIFVPALLRKYNKIQIYRVGIILTMVVGVIFYFVGYNGITPPNKWVHVAMIALNAIPEGFVSILIFTFSSDCVEYGQYMSGLRKEGLTFSIQTFAAKLYTAGALGLTSLSLMVLKYQPGLASYPTDFTKKMWFVNFIVPFIGSLVCLPLLYKYELTEKDVQVMADINSGKISEENGNKLLSKQYK